MGRSSAFTAGEAVFLGPGRFPLEQNNEGNITDKRARVSRSLPGIACDFKGSGGQGRTGDGTRRGCPELCGEPSGRLGLMMMIEVKEDTSQTGIVPETRWKNRVIS